MTEQALVGHVLADTYRVEKLLGKGGMGAVYAAAHVRLPTRFAIKVLHAEVAQNPELFGRFRREAEITSALRHPNILQVFDFNRLPDGTPYLVMELLEGEDLEARLKARGRLPYQEVLRIVQAVASGLWAAHKRQVVHRDLKPPNIFLVRQEEGDAVVEVPKIVDFGISKIRHADADTQRTRDQEVLGTPHYMSPEQARGDNALVDHRTDQWALAAIAYECLSGRKPFLGDSLAGVIYQVVLTEPPPLRSLAPEVPEHAEQAIRRALSKDREARFASVLDFARALAGQPVLEQRPPEVPPAHTGRTAVLPATPLPSTPLPSSAGAVGATRQGLGLALLTGVLSALLVGGLALGIGFYFLRRQAAAPPAPPATAADLRPAPAPADLRETVEAPDLREAETAPDLAAPPSSRSRPRPGRKPHAGSNDAEDVDISGLR